MPSHSQQLLKDELREAVRQGDADTVIQSLNNGADPDTWISSDSVLAYATAKFYSPGGIFRQKPTEPWARIIEALCEAGADPSYAPEYTKTRVIEWANRHTNWENVVRHSRIVGRKAIDIAYNNGDKERVRYFEEIMTKQKGKSVEGGKTTDKQGSVVGRFTEMVDGKRQTAEESRSR